MVVRIFISFLVILLRILASVTFLHMVRNDLIDVSVFNSMCFPDLSGLVRRINFGNYFLEGGWYGGSHLYFFFGDFVEDSGIGDVLAHGQKRPYRCFRFQFYVF